MPATAVAVVDPTVSASPSPPETATFTIAVEDEPVVTTLFPESLIVTTGCVVKAAPDVAPSAEPAESFVARPVAIVINPVATVNEPAEYVSV